MKGSDESLSSIMSFSEFANEELLLKQFESINHRTGTKIIIYNLTRFDSLMSVLHLLVQYNDAFILVAEYVKIVRKLILN
jgi:hypothetical protein